MTLGHSEKKLMYIENEVEPGVLQSLLFNKNDRTEINVFGRLSFVTVAFLENTCFFNTGLEHSRSDLVFK